MGAPMKISEALYAAGDHMEAFGHCPNMAYDLRYIAGGGTVATAPSCMIGSIHQTAGWREESMPLIAAMQAYVAPLNIPDYNEFHAAEEVVAAFRAAAVIEEAREEALETISV